MVEVVVLWCRSTVVVVFLYGLLVRSFVRLFVSVVRLSATAATTKKNNDDDDDDDDDDDGDDEYNRTDDTATADERGALDISSQWQACTRNAETQTVDSHGSTLVIDFAVQFALVPTRATSIDWTTTMPRLCL